MTRSAWVWAVLLVCGCSAQSAQDAAGASASVPVSAVASPSIDVLVRRCAPPPPTDTVPEWQGTPLHEAIAREDAQAVEALLRQGVDVNALDNYHHTPLRMVLTPHVPDPAPGAAEKRRHEAERHWQAQSHLLEILLAHGADPDRPDDRGDTPLILAAAFGYPDDQVQVLLTRLIGHGADVNVQNLLGATALMEAARRGSARTVRLLLDQGADPGATDCEGRTALDLARSVDHAAVIDLLDTSR